MRLTRVLLLAAAIVPLAAVKTYLVQTHGVAAARLSTAGFGDTKPVGDNKTEAGRAQNRRVELVKQ